MKKFLLFFILLVTPAWSQALEVTGHIDHPFRLSAEELRKLPSQEVTAEDHGTSHRYRGVPLADLLKQAGVPQGKDFKGVWMRHYLLAEGQDGYKAVFSLVELETKNVWVVYSQDDQELSAHDGPVRLVIPQEARPARWVRSLKVLRVEEAK